MSEKTVTAEEMFIRFVDAATRQILDANPSLRDNEDEFAERFETVLATMLATFMAKMIEEHGAEKMKDWFIKFTSQEWCMAQFQSL